MKTQVKHPSTMLWLDKPLHVVKCRGTHIVSFYCKCQCSSHIFIHTALLSVPNIFLTFSHTPMDT